MSHTPDPDPNQPDPFDPDSFNPDPADPDPSDPNPSDPNPSDPASPRRWWRYGVRSLVVLLLLGGGLGLLRLRQFIYEDLSPQVSRSLSTLVNRPVDIGEVESFWITGLRLGPTTMPPTAEDRDRVDVAAVDVRFNPLEVLWDRTLTLDITLVQPQVYLDQTADGAWLQLDFTPAEPGPITVELNRIWVDDATVTLQPFDWARLPQTVEEGDPVDPAVLLPGSQVDAPVPPIVLTAIDGDATFRNENRLIGFTLRGLPDSGGRFRLQGEADLDANQLQLAVQGHQLVLATLGTVVRSPLTVQQGTIDTNLEAALNLQDLMDFSLQGSLTFRDLAAVIEAIPEAVPQGIEQGNGRLRFRGQTVTVEDTRLRYGDIEAIAQGTVDLAAGYDLTVDLPSLTLAQLFTTFAIAPPEIELAGDFQITAAITGPLAEPQVSGQLRNRQAVQVDRLTLETVGTAFVVTPQEVLISDLEVLPTIGGRLGGTGMVVLGDVPGVVFDATVQRLPVDAVAILYGGSLPETLTLGALDAEVQVFGPLDTLNEIQAIATWRTDGTYPAQGDIAVENNQVDLRNTVVQALEGTLTATGRASLDTREWQAEVGVNQVPLAPFSPQLRGVLNADLALNGSLADLSPAGITARGTASLSDGVSLLTGPLTAAFAWAGDRLELDQAEAPGFAANGTITPDFSQSGAAAIAALDLNLRLEGFDLATLPATLEGIPPQVDVRGQVSFSGQLTGSGTSPTLAGNTQLDRLAINQLAFEPQLTGSLQATLDRGVALDVGGSRDRIALALNDRFLPTAVLVEVQGAALRAIEEGDRLVGEVEGIDLAWFEVAPAAEQGLGAVQGILSGTFQASLANLSNPIVTANVQVERPALGYINAQGFAGQLFYGNGNLSLSDGELVFPRSRYGINASYNPARATQLTGRVIAQTGELSDLLFALKIFDFEDLARGVRSPDFGTASDVLATAIDVEPLTLINRLRRLAEIDALQATLEDEEAGGFNLPSPSEASGEFIGSIDFTASNQTGFTADFNLEGTDWRWGDYTIQRVVAVGDLRDNSLTLLPLRAESGDAVFNLSGRIGGGDQSAQLVAENVPVAPLRELFDLPLRINGNLNANALLTGAVTEPRVTGAVSLVNGTLNATPIETALVRLSYNNARLNFIGEMLVGEIKGADGAGVDPEPLTASGSIPYALPFMTIAPESNALRLAVNVRDDGLALMNLFTNQVSWISGNGAVDVQVEGTLTDPNVIGSISLEDAVFAAQTLPAPITDVAGQINFNFDRIQVQSLTGNFSAGTISAQGVLPIARPFDESEGETSRSPLTVALRDIAMNFRGLYNGGVAGDLQINGTAFAPLIGGDIRLSNGRVFLPSGEQPVGVDPEPETAEGIRPPELNNLQITLGNNLQILSEPLINFIATGNLTINGTFDNLLPDGTVQLERGFVNLFTTRFNLTRGTAEFPQTAVFTPNQGLIPSLKVRLLAIVPEVTLPPTFRSTSGFSSSEIAESVITASDFGTVETVRIIATVDGPADRIFDTLELTSDPPRGESQIAALIGGGALSALTEGDETLAIVNLAGSAILGTLQNIIGRALGLSEFRLFPTNTVSDSGDSSTLGLAAEVGLEITSDLSVSILQVLTADDPPQLGLRYRLNDEFRVRGSISPNGNPTAVLEYQIRF
jgi:translocation and assembly module TamB